MHDDEAMDRAARSSLAALVAAPRRTRGSAASSPVDGDDRRRGRDRSRRAARTPRSRRCAPRASAPRRHRVRDARTRAHHGPHRPVRRRADRGRRRAASSSRSTIPTRGSRAPAFARLRAAGIDVDSRRRARPPRPRSSRRTCIHRRTGRPYVRRQGRDEPRRPDRGRRRLVALDHLGRGARRRARAARRLARRSSSEPAPRSPIGPRSPCATSRAAPQRRAAARAARRARSRPRRRPALRPRPRADARDHDRAGARAPRSTRGSAAGAKVEVVAPAAPTARRRPRRGARAARRARACSRRSSRAAARCVGALLDGGHAQRLVAYVAPMLLGDRRRARVRVRRPRHDRRRAALARSSTSRSSAPTSGSTYEPAALMFTGIVEELGRVRAITPNAGGARIEIDATTRARRRRASARRSRSTAAASPSSSSTTAAGPPTRSSRRSPARTSAPSRAGDPVNLERPVRLADRLGGHLVQGHVDGAGTVAARDAAARRLGCSIALRRAAPTCCATSCTRARSPSTASASPSPPSHDDGVRDRGDPAHARGHDARHRASRAPASTSKSTSLPSTWNVCCRLGREPRAATMTVRHRSKRAIDAVRRGEFVVVVDDEDRENEGDLIIAAEKMTPEKMAFMIRHTSGVICMPMEGDAARRAAAPADGVGRRQHRGAAHRVHGVGRRRSSAPPPASPPPTAARPCTR